MFFPLDYIIREIQLHGLEKTLTARNGAHADRGRLLKAHILRDPLTEVPFGEDYLCKGSVLWIGAVGTMCTTKHLIALFPWCLVTLGPTSSIMPA
jgi:hypothetical protein